MFGMGVPSRRDTELLRQTKQSNASLVHDTCCAGAAFRMALANPAVGWPPLFKSQPGDSGT